MHVSAIWTPHASVSVCVCVCVCVWRGNMWQEGSHTSTQTHKVTLTHTKTHTDCHDGGSWYWTSGWRRSLINNTADILGDKANRCSNNPPPPHTHTHTHTPDCNFLTCRGFHQHFQHRPLVTANPAEVKPALFNTCIGYSVAWRSVSPGYWYWSALIDGIDRLWSAVMLHQQETIIMQEANFKKSSWPTFDYFPRRVCPSFFILFAHEPKSNWT